jgi:hypothetical protein
MTQKYYEITLDAKTGIQTTREISPEEYPRMSESEIRDSRNILLKESDWTQLPDAPVDKVAWQTYRQELRDITSQPDFPNNIVWPTKPQNT